MYLIWKNNNIVGFKHGNKTVLFLGYENETHFDAAEEMWTGTYKIGTLTTETTPVYNVTTEDMSEAYRTVTTVTYYSDGTSKTSSTTQRYVDVYGTPTRSTSVLADESEWEVNYTYRINQYYAELFEYENGEPIDTGGGYGLFKMNGDWYFGNSSDYTKFPSNDNVIFE